MVEDAPFLPGLSPVAGKPVHLAFDGGRLTPDQVRGRLSDAGVLVLAEVERRLGLAERRTDGSLPSKVASPSWA